MLTTEIQQDTHTGPVTLNPRWLRTPSAVKYYTRDKAGLRQSVMYPGERKSVWELIQALRRTEPQSRNRMMPNLWATRQAEQPFVGANGDQRRFSDSAPGKNCKPEIRSGLRGWYLRVP
jgi:hypothetical protein